MLVHIWIGLVIGLLGNVSGLPANWWENSEGTAVKSNSQFKELVTGDDSKYKDKHIFIDFFMPNCYWCYDFQQDWNKLVDEFTQEYGEQNVVFMKIDGTSVYQVADKYGVESYPTFIYVKPNTSGMKAVMFKGNRSYNGMKTWMKKMLKDVEPVNTVAKQSEVSSAPGDDVGMTDYMQDQFHQNQQQLTKDNSQVSQLVQDLQAQIDTQRGKIDRVLEESKAQTKNIKSSYQDLSDNIDSLSQDVLNHIEKLSKSVKSSKHESPHQTFIVYLLGGIIIGCIGSVYMVKFIKINTLQKSQGTKQNNAAFTNQELNSLENEKLC